MKICALFILLSASPALADTVVAARTIRAQSLISAQDVALSEGDVVGALTSVDAIIGQEARVALYAGRPIRIGDVGPPAVIERNQIISLVFEDLGLRINTEGRSLSRGGPGDTVRVMNLSSRITISGRVLPDGRVLVSH